MESAEEGAAPAAPPSGAPAWLVVGRVGRAHGVSGEVRVDVLTDFPERRFAQGATVHLGPSVHGDAWATKVVAVRPFKGGVLVRLEGVLVREAAQALAGTFVLVPATDTLPLAEGDFYIHQLLGLQVVTVDGTVVGTVSSHIETGSADVLVISGPHGEQLIPLTAEVVAQIDPAAGRIVITPLPGLLDLPDPD